jgi:catechol 2,3-dioxygenase-like lactoylglutathione lyase family enzyme
VPAGDGVVGRRRASLGGRIGDLGELITKLVPILPVEDPDAERRFYEHFGLRTTYEGPEYPGFIAVGNDAVEFGLSRNAGAEHAAARRLDLPDHQVAVAERDGRAARRASAARLSRRVAPRAGPASSSAGSSGPVASKACSSC